MSKATPDLMDTLHGLVAAELTDIIKNGIPEVDKDGNVTRVPAPASYLAQAIKFLKDNGVQSNFGAGGVGDLAQVMKELDTVPFDGEIPSEFKH